MLKVECALDLRKEAAPGNENAEAGEQAPSTPAAKSFVTKLVFNMSLLFGSRVKIDYSALDCALTNLCLLIVFAGKG